MEFLILFLVSFNNWVINVIGFFNWLWNEHGMIFCRFKKRVYLSTLRGVIYTSFLIHGQWLSFTLSMMIKTLK